MGSLTHCSVLVGSFTWNSSFVFFFVFSGLPFLWHQVLFVIIKFSCCLLFNLFGIAGWLRLILSKRSLLLTDSMVPMCKLWGVCCFLGTVWAVRVLFCVLCLYLLAFLRVLLPFLPFLERFRRIFGKSLFPMVGMVDIDFSWFWFLWVLNVFLLDSYFPTVLFLILISRLLSENVYRKRLLLRGMLQ